MTTEKRAQIVELLQRDNSLEAEFKSIETKEEFQALFARNGIEVTDEEASEMLAEAMNSTVQGELNEDQLESVAGGIALSKFYAAWKWGTRFGIGITMIYDYYKYGNATKTYSVDNLIKGNNPYLKQLAQELLKKR